LRVPWKCVLGNHDYNFMNGDQAQIEFSYSERNPLVDPPSVSSFTVADLDSERDTIIMKRIDLERIWQMPGRNFSFSEVDGLVEFFAFDSFQLWTDPASGELAKHIQNLRVSLQASRAKWKIVFGHYPIYTAGIIYLSAAALCTPAYRRFI